MVKLAVVTEKESVARDIASALGGFTKGDNSYESDRYILVWAVGHILGLPAPEEIDPKYKRWVLQDLPILPKKFDLKPLEGMKGRLDHMAKTFRRKDVEGIVNACDAGREGELIFREIIEYTGTDKPIQRLWLQSMTTEAIRDGFARLLPGSKFDGLANAAWCRSEADWLVGMNATRAVTKRLQSRKAPEVWSAGRVQTPTLAMLVDHEFKILEFEPRAYWRIEGQFQASDHVYSSTWFDPNWKGDSEKGEKEDRILDLARAESILSALKGQPCLASETRKPERESAPLLFDLTTLQREANRRFSFSARRTLQAAQRLYEGHKALTYPRTDSRHLPEDYGPHVHQVLETFSSVSPYAPFAAKLLREGLLNRERVFDNTKISDHFAIIPTGVVPTGLEGDDAKVFDFVMRRFLAVFYPQAIWNRVERLTRVGEEHFRVRSRTLQVAGWREVIGTEDGAEERLPPLIPGRDQAEGVSVTALDFKLEEDVTKPPARISEGRLLGMMERAGKELEDEELSEIMADKGLGTPATRADTIENLISKGYVRRLREGLKPTAKGIRLIDFLHRIDTSGLASAELTGEWEKHLREVEHGAMQRASFMEGISDFTRGVVERIKEFQYDELYAKDGPIGPCPFNSKYPVVEFLWGYRCQAAADNNGDGCKGENCASTNGFVIWKETSGRYIDRRTASKLASERKTGTLAGFTDRQGREYQASLHLDETNQVRVVGNGSPDSTHDDETHTGETLGPCPCGQDCEVIETTTRYVCKRLQEAGPRAKAKDASSCGFALPKLVCKREITFEEASEYLTNGRTGVLEGFISRWNRPFPAILFRKEDGRFGFEFPPREGKKGGSSEKSSGRRPRAKAAAKGSARGGSKKTAAKRTTRKASSKKT